jgi:hypothetical protein
VILDTVQTVCRRIAIDAAARIDAAVTIPERGLPASGAPRPRRVGFRGVRVPAIRADVTRSRFRATAVSSSRPSGIQPFNLPSFLPMYPRVLEGGLDMLEEGAPSRSPPNDFCSAPA